jgi:1-deoxyxylulose-5-phosphate synthase
MATPLDETLAALDTIVQSGRARYVGVSNFFAWRVARALGRCELHGWARPVSVQPRYNLVFRENERELFPLAAQEGLAVLPYNPLAGGVLTGKHKPGEPPAGSRFTLGTATQRYQQRCWQTRMIEAAAQLQAIVHEGGLSLAEASIAWVLANPAVTSAIVGASRAEQLDDTLLAADVVLDPELKKAMDELTAEYRHGDATM